MTAIRRRTLLAGLGIGAAALPLVRVLERSRRQEASLPKGGDYQTVPNNRLLVSIAQAFGVDLVSYGIQAEAQYSGGTLPGL